MLNTFYFFVIPYVSSVYVCIEIVSFNRGLYKLLMVHALFEVTSNVSHWKYLIKIQNNKSVCFNKNLFFSKRPIFFQKTVFHYLVHSKSLSTFVLLSLSYCSTRKTDMNYDLPLKNALYVHLHLKTCWESIRIYKYYVDECNMIIVRL